MMLTPAQILAMLRAEGGMESVIVQFNEMSVDDRLELLFRQENAMASNFALIAEYLGMEVTNEVQPQGSKQ